MTSPQHDTRPLKTQKNDSFDSEILDSKALEAKLNFLLDAAKQAGATDADCMHLAGDGESLSLREGAVDSLERDETLEFGLRVFVDGRIASVSTNRSDAKTLKDLAERAVAMAKVAPVDPFAGLHDPADFATDFADKQAALDLYDPVEPETADLIERSQRAEAAALENTELSKVDTVGAGWGKSQIALATSRGFFSTYKSSSHSLSLVALAGEGGGMQRDYDYTSARYFEDLDAPEDIGRQAAERVVRRLNPVKKTTCRVPVIFDKRLSGSLLSGLAAGISGTSVARGSSFLKDSLGEAIFGSHIKVIDDPHRVRGFGSKVVDAEGMATTQKTIIDQGVLTTWILDLASAKQLGLTSTGNAARGLTGSPGPSVTNLYMEAGDQSLEDMISDLEEGFLITEMMGHGLNMTTGDYSRGAGGFWIRNGEICEAVNEMTVAGQMKDMFLNMRPASDLEFRGSIAVPSLLVEGLTVAGL